jgi:hypothetical protein
MTGSIKEQWFSQHPQGLLYKQRNTFRTQYRPRWFVLHLDRQVLGYHYLIHNELPVVDTNKFNVFSKKAPQKTEDGTPADQLIGFDPIPKAILHLDSCHVEINEKISCPEMNIFAFSVTPTGEGGNKRPWNLAATTEEARLMWVAMLAEMCGQVEDVTTIMKVCGLNEGTS